MLPATIPQYQFYHQWNKAITSEKDHMRENVKRIRQIVSQQKQTKLKPEPLRAKFIPGQKNSKYAHVPSRIGQILRAPKSTEDLTSKLPSTTDDKNKRNQINNQNENKLNRQMSKSTSDLIKHNSTARSQFSGGVSTSANGIPNENQKNIQFSRRSFKKLHPEQESVYNWRFSDSKLVNGHVEDDKKNKNCHHRIEYMCDGICAEETVVVVENKENSGGDSARSTSSRTSRATNTDETRIFQDKTFTNGFDSDDDNVLEEEIDEDLEIDKNDFVAKQLTQNMEKMRISSSLQNESQERKKQHLRGTIGDINPITNNNNCGRISQMSSKSQPSKGSVKIGTDTQANHIPGYIPKYLKQRQEEWKIKDEEKKAFELNLTVPVGHRLMPEEERQETITMLKKNYDDLISELNHIPIRMDTIRVREQKIRLEQQLTKLEEAMKIFSRPRVYVKLNT